MTRTEFYKEYAKVANINQKEARRIIEEIGDIVVSHMSDEDGVTPFDGITLKRSWAAPRVGRNPQTGETVNISGKWQPKAKFGKAVKDAIQE